SGGLGLPGGGTAGRAASRLDLRMAVGAPGPNLEGVRRRAPRGGRCCRGAWDRVRRPGRGVRANLPHRLRPAAPGGHGPDPGAPEMTSSRVWAVRSPGNMTSPEPPAWWIRGKGRFPELHGRRLLLFLPLHAPLNRRPLRVTTRHAGPL